MKVGELVGYGIPEKYVQRLEKDNIKELYKPQADVIKEGLFKRNLVLSLPTASGKTLIAAICMLHKLLDKRGVKVVYIAPLVALANEKYEYFKKFLDGDFKVAISVGDFDSADSWLADYDVVCLTTEKFDSLLRHNVGWVQNVDLIIVDEIHTMNDSSRGPTLEIMLTKLMSIIPSAQILGLSATINNAEELSKWLNATPITSDFRPVKLYEGVAFDSKIHFEDREGYELNDTLEIENSIIDNTLNLKKQALVFTSTRRNAESLAEKLCKTTSQKLDSDTRLKLTKLSKDIESVIEIPTQQCRKLAQCVKFGTAFHHAGLLGEQKRLIESNFRNGLIKAIVATPTLAMGVNLPAFRVIIRDAKRYYDGIGSTYIPVMDYKQFVGRAGRPTYDTFGESILLAKSEGDARSMIQHFILGQPEDITSKLALEPILRAHILALISSGFCNSRESIIGFFNRTFYAFHYNDIDILKEKLYDILKQLEEWSMIRIQKNVITTTPIGKRISDLYIDPLTAHYFLEGLKLCKERHLTEFSFLQLASNSLEIRPLVSVRSDEISDTEELIIRHGNQLLAEIPEEYDLEYDEFLKSVKTALMFDGWISESSEDQLLTKFKIAPGELYSKLRILDWLVYGLYELAVLNGEKGLLNPLKKLRIRLKYGIKEELVPLVKLKGIGRVRSRRLFNAGFDTLDKLRSTPTEMLIGIIGIKAAYEIKKQLGEDVKNASESQSTLKTIKH